MKSALFLFSLFALSHTAQASDWSSARLLPVQPAPRAVLGTPDPVYMDIFRAVDQTKLLTVLKQMTGVMPVTVNGSTYSITDRYAPASKAKFRAFWMQYMTSLGIPVQEMAYTTAHSIGETQGHNLEAVLPGKSKDSIVIIVHYDSIGPGGNETGNPGVDDDMTGMATLMETARILSLHKDQLQNTVRFVAADYEEQESPGLEGARQYAKYIKQKAAQEGFKILTAIDNEQSGWNCISDGVCSKNDKFDVYSCSGGFHGFKYSSLGDALAETATQFSTLQVVRGCMGENSDHYAMWEIGVPAVVFSEHSAFDNPHFDQNGGDTYDKIDQDYFFKIAQIGVVFAARMAVIQ